MLVRDPPMPATRPRVGLARASTASCRELEQRAARRAPRRAAPTCRAFVAERRRRRPALLRAAPLERPRPADRRSRAAGAGTSRCATRSQLAAAAAVVATAGAARRHARASARRRSRCCARHAGPADRPRCQRRPARAAPRPPRRSSSRLQPARAARPRRAALPSFIASVTAGGRPASSGQRVLPSLAQLVLLKHSTTPPVWRRARARRRRTLAGDDRAAPRVDCRALGRRLRAPAAAPRTIPLQETHA